MPSGFSVYQRFANTDREEGRGTPVALPGLFASREVAEEAAKGQGVYGSMAELRFIPVFGDITSFRQWEREQDPDWQAYKTLFEKFQGVHP